MATSNTQPAFPIEKEIKLKVIAKSQEDLDYLTNPDMFADDVSNFIQEDLAFEVKIEL